MNQATQCYNEHQLVTYSKFYIQWLSMQRAEAPQPPLWLAFTEHITHCFWLEFWSSCFPGENTMPVGASGPFPMAGGIPGHMHLSTKSALLHFYAHYLMLIFQFQRVGNDSVLAKELEEVLKFWTVYVEIECLELMLGAVCSCRWLSSSYVSGLLHVFSQPYEGVLLSP